MVEKITKDRIREIAASNGFSELVMTKDYYATVILYLLKDVDGLFFKGGTALQKIFLNYSRLSEDVDYTVTRDVKELKQEISSILLDSGVFSSVTQGKKVHGFVRLIAHYDEGSIFIDLNKRARLFQSSETHDVPHFYDEELPEFSVKTLSKREMFAEKIAATISRNKPRDHYDIYMLLENNFEIDYKLAKEKCKACGCEFDVVRMFNKAKKLHKRWNEDMLPLLSEEVQYEEVIRTLAKYFNLNSKR